MTCNNNDTFDSYTILVNKIYDTSRAINKISSNIKTNFKVTSKCPLPKNTKIKITEATLCYEICNLQKHLLINGHSCNCSKLSLQEGIYLDNKFIYPYDTTCDELTLSIVEGLKLDIDLKINIKGIAYITTLECVSFEAFCSGKDSIDTIILSNLFVPSPNRCFDTPFIKFNNNINVCVNPDYIYLSPVYDSECNIESLIGNIFINYCISLDSTSLIKNDMCALGKSHIPRISKYNPCDNNQKKAD